jgi:TM2 domain-containing membrane protein YozV
MEMIHCVACGHKISPAAASCPQCGQPNGQKSKAPYVSAGYGRPARSQLNFLEPVRSRKWAIILALFLGGLGAHKFYLGKFNMGVAYALFCWTLIPSVLALIEAIAYLFQDDRTFALQQQGIVI